MSEPKRFRYNIIPKERSAEWNVSPNFWTNHPDWNFIVRTDVRFSKNPRVWLIGGGVTAEEALKMATESVETDSGPSLRTVGECMLLAPIKAVGEETSEIIKN